MPIFNPAGVQGLPGAGALKITPGAKEQERLKLLRSITVDDIKSDFKNRKINKADYDAIMLEKAQDELGGALADNGYLKTLWDQQVKDFMEGWNHVVEAATGSHESPLKESMNPDLYNAGLGALGMVQMMFSTLKAVGETNGQVATNWALAAGASAGAANFIGKSVDVLHSFVPIGKLAKGFVKTAQLVTGDATQVAKVATDLESQVFKQTLQESLKLDGVAEVGKGIQAVTASKVTPQGIIDTAATIAKETSPETATQELPKLLRKFDFNADEDVKNLTNMVLSVARNPRKSPPGFEGQGAHALEVFAHLKAIEAHGTELQALAKKAIAGSDQDAINFARFATNLFTTTPSDGVTFTQEFRDLITHWDPEAVASGNFVGAMRAFAEDMAGLPVKNSLKFILQNQSGFLSLDKPWWGMAKEAYASLLLPLSAPAAVLGNSMALGVHMAESFAGAAFTADKTAGKILSESVYFAKGLMHAVGDALQAGKEAVMETNVLAPGRLDMHRVIPGLPGQIIRKPIDVIVAADDSFRALIERASLSEQYAAQATHLGIKDVGKYVTDKLNSAWPPPREMYEEMHNLQAVSTFQNELGPVARKFQPISQLFFLYFPFMKSYVDLTKYAWNRTPGLQLLSGQLYKEIAAGGRQADMAIGRLVTSNFVGYYLYELAKEGHFTGSGPADPAYAKAWEGVGNKPYTINTPFGKMLYKNMEPATAPLGFIADMAQIAPLMDEHSFGHLASAFTMSLMKNFVDTGAWHNVTNITDAIYAAGKKGIANVTPQERDTLLAPFLNIASGGPLVNRIAHIMDPVQAETHTLLESYKSRLPVYSKDVPPLLDSYADLKIPPQTLGSNWFGLLSPLIPKFYSPEEPNNIRQEGERLKARAPAFEWNPGGRDPNDATMKEDRPGENLGIQLSPQQHYEWARRWRDAYLDPQDGITAQMLSQQFYQDQKEAGQRTMYESFMHGKKKQAFFDLLTADKGLQTQMEVNLTTKAAAFLPEDQAKAFAETMKNGGFKSAFDSLPEEQQINLFKFGEGAPE